MLIVGTSVHVMVEGPIKSLTTQAGSGNCQATVVIRNEGSAFIMKTSFLDLVRVRLSVLLNIYSSMGESDLGMVICLLSPMYKMTRV